MSASGNDKSVVDRLLDAGVYAPLGFALTRSETLDDLAATGRKQIAFTRSLGRAAIKGLARGARTSQAGQGAEQATETADTAVETIAETGEVAGYDDLSAREIVALLNTCIEPQARWIRDREQAGKGRVTVLRAAERRL